MKRFGDVQGRESLTKRGQCVEICYKLHGDLMAVMGMEINLLSVKGGEF